MSPVPLEKLRRGEIAEAPRPGTHLARVLALLRKHPDQAWRAHEVAGELDADPHTIGAALRRLRARGFVDKHGPYWFSVPEREAGQLHAAIASTLEANRRLGPEDRRDWARLHHE